MKTVFRLIWALISLIRLFDPAMEGNPYGTNQHKSVKDTWTREDRFGLRRRFAY